MLELLAGLAVAVAALALVLEPLVRWTPAAGVGSSAEGIDFTDIEESESPKVRSLLALKEIEFDRATGKLSEEDYLALKKRYAGQALAAIQQEEAEASAVEAAAPAALDDPAEMAVARLKAKGKGGSVCPTCGPRPEAAATFCSSCGRSLVTPDASPRCPKCGASLPEGAKFCGGCGGRVAA